MNDLVQHFRDQGWVRIPGVVEQEALQRFKDHAISKWSSMGRPRVLWVDDVHGIDSFSSLQLAPKLLEAVKSLFSIPCYLGDTMLMFNIFEKHATRQGWHIDAGSEVPYGDYLYGP